MNKNEYMELLKSRLEGVDDELKSEIVNDYEEHFEMGAAEGKTEEQIVEELGSIDDLVNEIGELSGTSEKKNSEEKKEASSESAGNHGFSFNFDFEPKTVDEYVSSFAKGLGELSAAFLKGAGEVASSAQDFGRDFYAGFGKALNEAGKQAKSFGSQFMESMNEKKRSYSENVPEEENQVNPEEAEEKPEVKPEAMHMEEERAEYHEEPETEEDFDNYFAHEVSDYESIRSEESGYADKIVVKADCADVTIKESSDGKINFSYTNNGSASQQLAYRFFHRQEGHTIVAEIRRVANSNGFFHNMTSPSIDLEIEIPAGLRCILLRTVSGDIEAEDINCVKAELSSMSGDINASGKFETLKLATMSGDIDVSSATEGAISCKSISGDINLKETEAAKVSANSVSGDICVALPGSEGYTARVSAVSGDINLRYGTFRKCDAKSGSYVFGNGECELCINSVSGDISVKD